MNTHAHTYIYNKVWQGPRGWPLGARQSRCRAIGTRNMLKQSSVYFRKGLASAEVLWPLFTGPHYFLSDSAGVIKALWQTQAGF